ncbi:MAG: transcription antitermination factor NusB [Aggregatilineaceae bacterium]
MSNSDYRRDARALALQVLYEVDCTRHPLETVWRERLTQDSLRPETVMLARRLVEGVLVYKPRLDILIRRYAPEWPLEQIAIVDRNILRMAIYEMMLEESVPLKVAINEAIGLAKMFGSESTPRFVNGVLGTLAAHPDEVQAVLGTAPPSMLT